MNTNTEHDGTRLRLLMSRANINTSTLSRAMNVTTQAVEKWLASGQIARAQIAPLCRVLRCSADELLGLVPIAAPKALAEARAIYLAMSDQLKHIASLAATMRDEELNCLEVVATALSKLSEVERTAVVQSVPQRAGQ